MKSKFELIGRNATAAVSEVAELISRPNVFFEGNRHPGAFRRILNWVLGRKPERVKKTVFRTVVPDRFRA